MKLADLELANMIPGTAVRTDQPLRKLIRSQDTASKKRELMRTLKRGNNPDPRPDADVRGDGSMEHEVGLPI